MGIGWWFVRSYILYDGDFLGLRTRSLCGELYGNEDMKADVRITYQSMGYTIFSMLFRSDFLVLSLNSFICMYGPMVVTTALWVYRFYKLLFLLGILGSLLPLSRFDGETKGIDFSGRRALNKFFHGNMLLCMLIPFVLSIIYSYGIDYQPQGRYLMPVLIPLCYYCIRGLEKGSRLFCILVSRLPISHFHSGKGAKTSDSIPKTPEARQHGQQKKTMGGKTAILHTVFGRTRQHGKQKRPVSEALFDSLLTGLCGLLILVITAAAFLTIFGYAFPYYSAL